MTNTSDFARGAKMKSRLILLLMVLGLVFTPLAWGQYQYSQVFDNEGEAAGFETISTTTASIGFTSSKVCVTASDGGKVCAKAALISVETAAIRFTLDGTTPTVTAGTGAGHLMDSGDSYVVRGFGNLQRFRCINAVGSSGAAVKVTYFF